MPGDKSISHRAAIISALAVGDSILNNFSTSDDCASTLDCLRRLGVPVERAQNCVSISGRGVEGLKKASGALDCGNSGTTIRLLSGVLAGQNFESELTGDVSLRSRPMARITEPLEQMGARILTENGHAPIRIDGHAGLAPIIYEMPIASAQVKSCILLAGLGATGRTSVIERVAATRDHTERMLAWFGASLETNFNNCGSGNCKSVSVDGPVTLSGRSVAIPGDISSATFFLAAASFIPGSDLELSDVGLNPTRARIIKILQDFGADLSVKSRHSLCNEPVGNLHVTGNRMLHAGNTENSLRGALIPELIDELPMLAVLGTQIVGGLTVRDATELRFKETDRIAATAANLRAMGATVEEFEDGLSVEGPVRLKGAVIDTRGDHRMGMAFAIAALLAEGPSEIVDPDCVNVSFPEFFRFLESIVER